MARRYIARKVTTKRDSNAEFERLRRELQSYLQQELTRLFNEAAIDMERNLAQSLTGIAAGQMHITANGQPNLGTGGIGSTLTGLLSRYTRGRSRTRTETSGAVETGRSSTENQLYRESASQVVAASVQSAESGHRNI